MHYHSKNAKRNKKKLFFFLNYDVMMTSSSSSRAEQLWFWLYRFGEGKKNFGQKIMQFPTQTTGFPSSNINPSILTKKFAQKRINEEP